MHFFWAVYSLRARQEVTSSLQSVTSTQALRASRRAAILGAANRKHFAFLGEDVPQADIDLQEELDRCRVSGRPHPGWKEYAALSKKCGVPAKHLETVTHDLQRRGAVPDRDADAPYPGAG